MCNVTTCGKSHISKKKPTNCPKLCIDSTSRTPVTTYATTKTSIAENTLESSCKNKYPVSQNISKCVISNCCQRSAPSASTTRMKLCPAKEKNKIVIKKCKDCPWKGENLLVVGRGTLCKQETKTNVSEMNSESHAPEEIVPVETEVVKVTSIPTFRKNIKLYESQAETIVKKISSELPSSTHSIKHFSVTEKAISIENDDHSGRNNGNANQVNDDTDAKNEEEVDLNETSDEELSPEIDSKIPDGRKVSVESLVQEKEKQSNLVSEEIPPVEIASTIESSNPNIGNGPEKYLSDDITTTETSESNSKETDDNSQHISIKSHSLVGSTQMTEPSENVQNPPAVNEIESIKKPNSKNEENNSGVISQHAQTAKLSFKCKGNCQCFMDPGMVEIKELDESDETPNNSSRNVPPHITAENSSVESETSTATIPRSPIESTLVEIVSTTDTSETDTKNISKESAPVEIKSTSKNSETNSKSYGISALPDNNAGVNPQHSQPARASIKCKGKCCECSLELGKSEILELAEKSNETPYNSIENLLPHTSDEEFSIGKKSSDANILSSFSGSTQKTETKEGVQESAGMTEKDDDRTEKECRCPQKNDDKKVPSKNILEKISIENLVPKESKNHQNYVSEDSPVETVPVDETSESNTNNLEEECRGTCENYLEHEQCEIQEVVKRTDETSHISIRNEKEFSDTAIPITPPGLTNKTKTENEGQESTELNEIGDNDRTEKECECIQESNKKIFSEIDTKYTEKKVHSIELATTTTTIPESNKKNIPEKSLPVENTSAKITSNYILEKNETEAYMNTITEGIPQNTSLSFKCKGHCQCFLDLKRDETQGLTKNNEENSQILIRNSLPHTTEEVVSAEEEKSKVTIPIVPGVSQEIEADENVQPSELNNPQHSQTAEASIICKGNCECSLDLGKSEIQELGEKTSKTPYNSIENLLPHTTDEEFSIGKKSSDANILSSFSGSTQKTEAKEGIQESAETEEKCECPQNVVPVVDNTTPKNEKDDIGFGNKIKSASKNSETNSKSYGISALPDNIAGVNPQHSQPARESIKCKGNSEEVVAVDEYSTEKILSKSASPYQVCHEENACFLKIDHLVISENIYECISEQCREEFLKKESECNPDVKKSIIKLALDKADKPGEYVVLRGPMFVRKSLLDHSTTPKEVQDIVKPMISDTVKSFLDCKRCCREGKCIAKELLNICKSDPDGIIEMYRSQIVDQPYLEEKNLLSDVFQMQKTHGEVYGDQKYHYLMVDKTASVDDTMFQNETEEETVRKETFSDYDETLLGKGTQVPVRRRSEFSSMEQVSDVTESSFAIPAGEKHIPVEQEHIPVEEEHIPGEEKHPKESHIDVVEQKTSSVVIEPGKKSLEELESKEPEAESEGPEAESKEREAEPNKLEAARSDFENFRQSRVTRESNISWEAPAHHKASGTIPSADSIEKLAEDAKKRRERFLGNTNQKKAKNSAFEDILKEEKEKTDSRGPSKLEANSPSMASKESIESAVQTKCCGMKKKKKSPKKPPEKKGWEKANRKSTISHISRLDGYDTDPETTSDQLAKQHAFSFESDGSSSLRAHSRVENPILEEQRRLSKYSNV